MSISKFQNVIKGGCGQVVIFGMAFVFIGGLAYQGCGANLRGGGGNALKPGEVQVAQVAGVPISAQAIQSAVDAQLQQFGGSADALPASFEIVLLGGALSQAIEQANSDALAKQNGIDISDAGILKFLDADAATLPQRAREQLTQAGLLKAGASEAEFEAAVKKAAQGRTIPEIIKQQREVVQQAFADPKKAPLARAELGKQIILDAYKKKASVSDDDLRKSYDRLQVKRIVVPFVGATPGGPAPAGAVADEAAARAKADKALAEVRGGKAFEAAMVAYSGEPATAPGKPVSDNVLALAPQQLDTLPEYAPIRNLKPGETSGVEKTPEGFVIYKVVGTKNELPKDFATRTAFYRDQLVGERAQKAYQEDLKRYSESHKPEFSSDAYAALYAFNKLSAPAPGASPNTPPPTPTDGQLREVIDQAKRVGKDDPSFRIAAIVRRAAFDKLYAQAKDKNALTDERIETLTSSLDAKDDFDGRIELVDTYTGQRKYKEAAEQLTAAARANTTYDAQGQTRFGTVASKLVALKKDGQLSSEAEASIQGEQDNWRDQKKAADVAQAEAAKLQAQDAAAKAAQDKAATDAARPKPKIQDVPSRR